MDPTPSINPNFSASSPKKTDPSNSVYLFPFILAPLAFST
jgi:hypothetical protein